LLVGLGNPGRRYASTRHNVGFRVVERFAARHSIAIDERRCDGHFGLGRLRESRAEIAIFEPQSFMNLSGDAVADLLAELGGVDPARELVVVFDDVDLPFGRLRLRASGGAGGHRGLAHIQERLASREQQRLRFGVGRPAPGGDTADYVLAPFAPEEEAALPAHLERACDALDAVFAGDFSAAMGRFNRDPESTSAPDNFL
jgi:PTH1 family peptidyl-tRNA hydrolase